MIRYTTSPKDELFTESALLLVKYETSHAIASEIYHPEGYENYLTENEREFQAKYVIT